MMLTVDVWKIDDRGLISIDSRININEIGYCDLFLLQTTFADSHMSGLWGKLII